MTFAQEKENDTEVSLYRTCGMTFKRVSAIKHLLF